jgi:hypothetical protein
VVTGTVQPVPGLTGPPRFAKWLGTWSLTAPAKPGRTEEEFVLPIGMPGFLSVFFFGGPANRTGSGLRNPTCWCSRVCVFG